MEKALWSGTCSSGGSGGSLGLGVFLEPFGLPTRTKCSNPKGVVSSSGSRIFCTSWMVILFLSVFGGVGKKYSSLNFRSLQMASKNSPAREKKP